MRLGIASKFAVITSLLVLVATSTVGYMVYRGAERSLMEAATERLAHTAEVIDVRFAASIQAIGKDVHFLAATPPVAGIVRARTLRGLDPETAIRDDEWQDQLAEIFQAFLVSRPSYFRARFIGVADGGRELLRVERRADQVYRAPARELQRKGDQDYFQEATSLPRGSLYLSEIRYHKEEGEPTAPEIPVLYAATPIYTAGGALFGIIIINVDFRDVLHTLQALVDPDKALYIASSRGGFLLKPDSLPQGRPAPAADSLQELFPQTELLLYGSAREVRIRQPNLPAGKPGVAYFRRLPFDRGVVRQDLVLGVAEPHATILAGVRRVRNQSALITLLFCLAGIALALSVSGYLTRPLRQITRAVSSFGRDEQPVALPVQRGDEIGILARAFDAMARQIQDQIRELEDKEHRQRTILETSAEGIVVTDAQGTVEIFNAAAEHLLGYSAQEVIGRPVHLLIQPHPQDAPREEAVETLLGLSPDGEAAGRRQDGSLVPLSITWSTFELAGEKRFTIFLQDITERKEAEAAQDQLLHELETERASLQKLSETLEERVKSRTADLVRINKALEYRNRELRDFAYVASHDLQEPLRKLRAFADLLQSEYEAQIDGKGQFYIQRMYDAAERMSRLITDLLAFSRITTQGQPFEQVDLSQIAQEVLSDLEISLAEAGGEVQVEDLPTVEADPTQMRQLLQNLIANALKFRKPDVPPRVRVYATIEMDGELSESGGEVCRLVVEDNGIGFDEKYLDRIFSPFQRLHNRDAYEGTGMGLTICRRIVERHNGTITARSTPDEGTAFIVALPVYQRQASKVEDVLEG